MRYFLVFMLLIFFLGCSNGLNNVTGNAIKEIDENTGVKISNAELNDDGEYVHNIFNFDTINQTVKVTTICYGDAFEIISDNDSYIMTIPPNSVAGWMPSCPLNTMKYKIQIDEIESQ